MDLLQLKYFRTVALHGNITRAAKSLHISQPSLSIMISRLEKELGVPLFDRKGRGISLNSYGAIMLEHTNTLLNELDKAIYEINLLKEDQDREIDLCSNAKGISSLLIKDFLRKTDTYRIRQRICGIEEAENLLLRGDCDFAVTQPPLQNEELRTITLYNGNVVCAMSKEHPLAEEPYLTPAHIKNEKFFSLYVGDNTRAQRQLLYEEYFGYVPNIIFEGDKDVIIDLVEENQGIFLTIKYSNFFQFSENLRLIPVRGLDANWEMGLSWKKANERNAACLYFLQYAKKHILENDVLSETAPPLS